MHINDASNDPKSMLPCGEMNNPQLAIVQMPTPRVLFMNPMPKVSSKEASRTNPLAFLAKTSPTLLHPPKPAERNPLDLPKAYRFERISIDTDIGKRSNEVAVFRDHVGLSS